MERFRNYQQKLEANIKNMCDQRGKISVWRQTDENGEIPYVEIAKSLRNLIEEEANYYGITVNIGAIAFAINQCMKNIGKLLNEIPREEKKAQTWAYYAVEDEGVSMTTSTSRSIGIFPQPGEESIRISLRDPETESGDSISFDLGRNHIHFDYLWSGVSGEMYFEESGYAIMQAASDEVQGGNERKNSVIPHIPAANLWTSAGEGETMTDEEFLLVFPEFAKKTYRKKKRPDKA